MNFPTVASYKSRFDGKIANLATLTGNHTVRIDFQEK